ncbi:MAG: hypothetical protein HY301_19390 [Verrucomicrobia bacterium]|nr:hypothetical protein [Verrucomicrobiota bacterium]
MMLKKDANFRRLKVGGLGPLGSASYWLAKDHLLVVEVISYSERYRRFYFRDLQAVIVQQTGARKGWNIGFGVALLIALVIALVLLPGALRGGFPSGGDDYGVIGIWSAIFLVLGLPLLVNTLRGPTCTVHLRTAVQTQKLRNLTRWRKAELLVTELGPLVQSAQAASAAASVASSDPADAATAAPPG